MFGQASTPFGSPAGGFGQANTAPAFGSPAPSAFGAPPAPAYGGGGGGGGGFGTPAPAPSGFGGFGAPAPSSGFGGGGGGGGGGFGAPAPAPSGFGSAPGGFGSAATNSSPFGAPAPAPSGGLFGAPAAAPAGGLFGAPAPSPGGFGAPPASSGFGGFGAPAPAPSSGFGGGSTFGAPAPAPSSGLFGAPAPAAGGFGGFGSPAPAPAGFGAPAPAPQGGGLFGAPAAAPAPAGGMFGAPAGAPAAGGGGTKATPFQVTTRQDGTSSIVLQAITAMPTYENKSFEELRMEDYQQGNRGAGTGAQPAGAGFGGFGSPAPAPAPAGGLFGAPAPAPGGFGAPAPAPGGFGGFGSPAPAPGGFGAPAPAPGGFGGFGAPAAAPAPGGFGAPAPAPGGFGGFGAKPPAPGGLFGAPAPAPGGGMFGSSPAAAPGGFGAPAPAPGGGMFGAPAPAPGGGLFGAPAPAPGGGLFGAPAPAPGGFGAPAPAPGGFGFGAPAPAPGGGGLFGAPAPAPGGYGAPAPGGYGAPAPGGGMFGAPAPSPGGGLFGAKPATSGFFGGPAPAYGTPAPAPSMYGAPAPAPQYMTAPPAGSVIPPAANELFTQQLTALENQRKELEKMDVWKSKSSESSAIVAASLPENDAWSSVTPIRASFSPYRASPKSNAKIRPRGFASPEKTTAPSLSALGNGTRPMMTPDSLAASSVTRLVIRPSPNPKMKLLLEKPDESKTAESPLRLTNGFHQSPSNEREQPSSASTSERRTPPSRSPLESRSPPASDPKTPTNGRGYDYYKQVIGSPDEAAGIDSAKKSVAPKLTKEEYTCTPSIDILLSLSGEDLAAIAGFSVERKGFGRVEWEGAVDVRGADLDRIAVIEQSAASMYMKDEEENKKPPVGSKLNRPSILTLYNVFPKNGGANADQATKDKFANKVEKSTKKMGAAFISYDSASGEWKMRVQHFSKYGLADDDSESEPDLESQSNFESGERGGRSLVEPKGILKERKDTPYKPSSSLAFMVTDDSDEDEEEDETAVVSDMEIADDSKVLEEGEAAYTNMLATVNVLPEKDEEDNNAPFPEESEAPDEAITRRLFVPTEVDLSRAAAGPGICARLAAKAGTKSSSTDFGMRLGRSFRVGWSPDGSFLHLGSNGCLVRCRPVFTKESDPVQASLLETLETHSEKKFDSSCPEFTLPSSVDALSTALKSYADDSEDEDMTDEDEPGKSSVTKQAFSLLSRLLDSKERGDSGGLVVHGDSLASNASFLEERRMCDISQWLVDSCSKEVNNEIKSAKSQNDKYAALLAAVTGGDIDKACSTAAEMGFVQLAGLLAAGPQGRSDILKEAHSWTDNGVVSRISDELIRIYFLIGGDLKMEGDLYRRNYSQFDWRRRLAMRLTYDSSRTPQSLSSLIQEYESNLSAGVAPYPQPHYLSSKTRKETQCVLYRLLRMGTHELEVSLPEVIDPLGHTDCEHDFSLAFHLAAAISAMGSTSPLTSIEEQHLVDGYMAQLVDQGYWEWAVYVSLCLLDTSSTLPKEWKVRRAKNLVLQNYRDDEQMYVEKRHFLESVGLPAAWFEEAIALRCANNGDSFGYLKHMAAFSPQEACATLEQVLIPNMLFMSKDKVKEALNLIEVFSATESSLASAVFDFFQVYQNILLLEGASRAKIDAAVPALFETCDGVEQIFASYRLGEEKLHGPALRIIPPTKLVPMTSFLAEGLAQISLFKLQLKALEAGVSISNIASQLLNITSSSDFKESGMSSRDNMLRWLM